VSNVTYDFSLPMIIQPLTVAQQNLFGLKREYTRFGSIYESSDCYEQGE